MCMEIDQWTERVEEGFAYSSKEIGHDWLSLV